MLATMPTTLVVVTPTTLSFTTELVVLDTTKGVSTAEGGRGHVTVVQQNL